MVPSRKQTLISSLPYGTLQPSVLVHVFPHRKRNLSHQKKNVWKSHERKLSDRVARVTHFLPPRETASGKWVLQCEKEQERDWESSQTPQTKTNEGKMGKLLRLLRWCWCIESSEYTHTHRSTHRIVVIKHGFDLGATSNLPQEATWGAGKMTT